MRIGNPASYFFCYLLIYLHIYILFWRFTYAYNSLSSSSFLCSLSPAYITAVKSTGFFYVLLDFHDLLESILFWKLILSIFRFLNAKNIIQALCILYKICSNREKKNRLHLIFLLIIAFSCWKGQSAFPFSLTLFFSLYLFRLIVFCYHLLSPEIQCFHSIIYPVLQLALAN